MCHRKQCIQSVYRNIYRNVYTLYSVQCIIVYSVCRIFNLFQEGRSYETKGGPIHSLVSCNVAKFSSEDVLVGDTNGLLTIITNGQILKRTQLCNSKINAMVLDVDSGIFIIIYFNELYLLLGKKVFTQGCNSTSEYKMLH